MPPKPASRDPFGAPLLDLCSAPDKAPRPSGVDPARAATLFAGGRSCDIMQRLLEGDPLKVGPCCQARVKFQAVLLDPPRLKWRALAYTAFLASRNGPAQHASLDAYLNHAVDESIASLIEEDWLAENEERPVTLANTPFRQLPGGARMPPERARHIALEFNLLRHAERRPLFAILVGGRSPMDVARAFGMTEADLGAQLDALLDRMEVGGR